MAMKNATAKTKELGATRFKIDGKRWFQQSGGNTYHSVQVSALVGDNWVSLGGIPYSYGYGDQYAETGVDWLIENDYLEKSAPYDNGLNSHYGWPFREDNNIDVDVVDVNRKRDL